MSSTSEKSSVYKHIIDKVDYYISVILLSVLAYFLIGVFSQYAISIIILFMCLWCTYAKGGCSLYSVTLWTLCIISMIWIDAEHYMHTLVMLIMVVVFFVNKKLSTLWFQNGVLCTVFILLMLKPGIYLIVFANYNRMLEKSHEWFIGVWV